MRCIWEWGFFQCWIVWQKWSWSLEPSRKKSVAFCTSHFQRIKAPMVGHLEESATFHVLTTGIIARHCSAVGSSQNRLLCNGLRIPCSSTRKKSECGCEKRSETVGIYETSVVLPPFRQLDGRTSVNADTMEMASLSWYINRHTSVQLEKVNSTVEI